MIGCRGTAAEALTVRQAMMSRLRLTVNETKTRRCRGPDEAFDFLGYTIGRCYAPQTGWPYIGVRPSAKSLQGLCRKISVQTERRWSLLAVDEMVGRLNHLLRGWANYFCLGTVTRAYGRVTAHAGYRLRQWLRGKHQLQGSQWTRYSDHYLHETLGLVRLRRRPLKPLCANV